MTSLFDGRVKTSVTKCYQGKKGVNFSLKLRDVIKSRSFKCCLSNHRKAFYRSANAVFGKVDRVASEEITLQLINRKCILSLLYCLEACPLVKSELSSLDFVVNRFFYENV